MEFVAYDLTFNKRRRIHSSSGGVLDCDAV
jgi:hypothetical protein